MGYSRRGKGRRQISQNADRKWGYIYDENRRPRHNHRIHYPPRGYLTSSPTLVRLSQLSQLTEPNRIYGTDERKPGKRKIGWAQAIYPLRAQLQELKKINLLPEKWDDTLEDKLTELKKGEQAFMSTRPNLIQAGYTTLDSIPRIQKGSGTRLYCPALKGIDSKPKK